VGGSLVIHLASAVVEAVPGCVTPSYDPSVLRLAGKCSQWCQHIGSSNPHVAVIIYYSNERSNFFLILRFGNLHDGFHLVTHGFDSITGNPVP